RCAVATLGAPSARERTRRDAERRVVQHAVREERRAAEIRPAGQVAERAAGLAHDDRRRGHVPWAADEEDGKVALAAGDEHRGMVAGVLGTGRAGERCGDLSRALVPYPLRWRNERTRSIERRRRRHAEPLGRSTV